MSRHSATEAAGRRPAPSFVDWPSTPGAAPGAAGSAPATGWRTPRVRLPASGGIGWLLTLLALFALYAASWRYFPY